MQPGDVPVTFADTKPLEDDFGFKPSTPLREGLRAFAEWYASYYGTGGVGTDPKPTLYGVKMNQTESFNPDCENMMFYSLPFRKVEDFDYPAIAKMIEDDGADIIWMALGAPWVQPSSSTAVRARSMLLCGFASIIRNHKHSLRRAQGKLSSGGNSSGG